MLNWTSTAPQTIGTWPLTAPQPACLLGGQLRTRARSQTLDLADHCWRQAMQAAGLEGLLLSTGDIQLLVPSDRAFIDLMHELKLSQAELFADLPKLRRLLLGHVLVGADALALAHPGAMVRTANQSVLRRLDGGRLRDAMGRQAQTLGQMTQRQGLTPPAYLIDRVMLPADRGLLDLLADSPAHSEFLAALQLTGMASWLQGGGPFTVLAPCNSTWRAQKTDQHDGTSSSLASRVSSHLLAGRWLSDEMPWGGSLPTLSGEPVRLSALGLIGNSPQPQALHSASDKLARNGVLHLIVNIPVSEPSA